MSLFKVQEIKKMLEYVEAEQISFSRMVELLNEKVNKFRIKKEGDIEVKDIVNILDAYLTQDNCTNLSRARLRTIRGYLLVIVEQEQR
jgi:hypothetical protein